MIGLGGAVDPSTMPTLVLADTMELIEDVPKDIMVVVESPEKTSPMKECEEPSIESAAAAKAATYSSEAPSNAS